MFQSEAFQANCFQTSGYASLLEASGIPRAWPLYLVEISLKMNGPVLYFSERNITIDAVRYEDYIEEVKGLGLGDMHSEAFIVFKNERFRDYEHLIEIGGDYPFEAAECVIKRYDILSAEAPKIIFKGVLGSPEAIDTERFRCPVLSVMHIKDRAWRQAVLETSLFPSASEDLGRHIPIVYGSDILIPALRTDWGARTTLKTDITATDSTLELTDASRFPSSGSIWIDDEKIGYISKNGNILNGLTRGQSGTSATAHRAGSEVWQDKTVYESVLCAHELHSVGNVYAEIDGKLLRVDSGLETVFESGFHKLRATSKIGINPVQDNIGVSASGGDTAREKKTISISGLPYTLSITSTSVSSVYVDLPLPPAPSGTLEDIFIEIDFAATGKAVGETYYFTIDGYCVAQANSDGTLIQHISSPIKLSLSSWRTGYVRAQIYSYHIPPQGSSVNLKLTINSACEGCERTIEKTGKIIATRFVERFHAKVSGHKDIDGSFGGTGSVIERPDHVIRHFLTKWLGFSTQDIDTESFNQAGEFYSQAIEGGYRFGFAIAENTMPSEFLKRLATECRSTLRYEKGKWRLSPMPDSPTPAVRSIKTEELAGRCVFSKTPLDSLANDLSARFLRNYSKLAGNSEWDGTAVAKDIASQSRYGRYHKKLQFHFIRTGEMAESVLSHMLIKNKTPRLVAELPVYWEHFDLNPEDTIEIEGPLYSGKRFIIEGISFKDNFRAVIRAAEWW